LSSRQASDGLTVWGRLITVVWAIAMVLIAQGFRAGWVLLVVVMLCVLSCPRALRMILRPDLWVLVGSALLLSAFMVGARDTPLGPVTVSTEGVRLGLEMALRAVTISLAFNSFATCVSVVEMTALFDRLGARGLGFAVSVAFNQLPSVRERASTALMAMRLRGGFLRHRLDAARKLLITVLAGSLKRGDEIVDAAESRGFDPMAIQLTVRRVSRADVVATVALLVISAAILLL